MYLFKEISLKLNDKKLLSRIEIYRCIVQIIIDKEKSTIIEHSDKIIDILLKSLWWMTNQINLTSEKKPKNQLMLKIRKTLGSLLDFTRKACEYPKDLIESGAW